MINQNPQGRKLSVLVVDDNAANVFLLATMIKRMGMEVDEASSGMEAINNACEKEYDLILMDYLMPDMDGIQAIKQITFISNGEKTPVIIGVSATVDEEIKIAFQNVGAKDVLQKPVDMNALIEKLKEYHLYGESDEIEEVEQEDFDICKVLSSVDGLDYEKGLNLMVGSIENYMRVINVCVKNVSENCESIEAIKDTDSLDGFALYFHSLKGIFLNIGADGIADDSKRLEFAAKAGEIDRIHSEVDDYLSRVKSFNEQLKDAYDKYVQITKKDEQKEGMSQSEFSKKVNELKEYIEDFEYIEITELLETMLQGCSGQKKEILEKISAHIQQFEYAEAMEQAEQLLD